jgi:hypothetical protein
VTNRTRPTCVLMAAISVAVCLAAESGRIPLRVEHCSGNDPVGSRLVQSVSECIRNSAGFTLADRGFPRVDLYMTTMPKDEARPGAATIYCVVWLFKSEEGTAATYLSGLLGHVSNGRVNVAADSIFAETGAVISRTVSDKFP